MPMVVGVAFKPVTKIYHFDPVRFLDLRAGTWVIVDTARGHDPPRVVEPPHMVSEQELAEPLKPVVRRATPWDMVRRDKYAHLEAAALKRCREKAAEYKLPMKIVRAEYSFDGGRLMVYFASEERVDFRALVRDLAQTLRTRIEMKQIGVRDEAKMLDGVGRCGRQLCCASWLREFNPVSIKMAKQQDLPLNPTEISGVCGRLLCCLGYEMEAYAEIRKRLPKTGAEVVTPQGVGRVRQVHTLKETVVVRLEDGAMIEVPVAELTWNAPAAGRPACAGCAQASAGQPQKEDETDLDEENQFL